MLLGWSITGDVPANMRVLLSVREGEPEGVSGVLSGSAVRWLDRNVDTGFEYRYWLEAVEEDGAVSHFGPVEASWPGPDADRLTLYTLYPCPVTDQVTLSYYIPVNIKSVEFSLYDLSGRLVASSVSVPTAPGRHEVVYDTSVLLSGVYVARLTTEATSITKRLIIAR
ncbi:T9SS type A sorting domain-containing protein [bacterium]|nr:T9SS type A sorting domain-containing protein [bacterium]